MIKLLITAYSIELLCRKVRLIHNSSLELKRLSLVNIHKFKRTDEKIGLFQKKNCNLPVEDINGKFQGVHQKLRKKHEFPGGSMQKNGKFQGVN